MVSKKSHQNSKKGTIMSTLEEVSIDDEIDREILNSSTDDIINRTRLMENEIKVQQPLIFVRLILDYEI